MPHYPRHLATFDYRGFHRYSLTFCTFERNPYFAIANNVAVVWQQILRASAEYGFAVLAYCFMPDHVHLLPEGTRDDADLKAFIKFAKQSVIRYIIENPVRAGLVKTPMDYPFWGSAVYSREELIEYVAWRTDTRAG